MPGFGKTKTTSTTEWYNSNFSLEIKTERYLQVNQNVPEIDFRAVL